MLTREPDSRYHDSFWHQGAKLRGQPALILWGLKDSALKPHQLSRWRAVLSSAPVVEWDNVGLVHTKKRQIV